MKKRFGPIWGIMEGQRVRYLGAIGALVIASVFLYAAPLVVQVVIDGVLSADDQAGASWLVRAGLAVLGGKAFLSANLWIAAVAVLCLTLCAGVFTYLRGRWSAMASENIARRLRDRVYDHLQHLPSRYFDTASTGDLIQRCTSDVETLRMFLASQVVEIGRALIMLLLPIPLMLAIDWRMTIASVVWIPLIVVFSIVFFRKVKAAFLLKDEAEGAMTATIQENLTGVRVVRAFARQEFEESKLEATNGLHRQLDFKLYKLMGWYWSSSDLLCFLQITTVVSAGMFWLAGGSLTVGAFYYFFTAVMMFLWPVRMMGRVLTELGKAIVALGRVEEILAEPIESVEPDRTDVPMRGDIEFKGVTFSHEAESPLLEEISFTVKQGQTLAILGPSGCGKSTIINLLLRLYDTDEGQILVDGVEISSFSRKQIRGACGVVMQEPFLYSKTIGQNLKIARPGASEKEMIEAASHARIHESIESFEHAYDTRVGERGVTLSGGQRQRVAIARALLQEPSILILDDALSAVDTGTERAILKTLRERHGVKTTIVVAHRLSTVMHADQVLVLDHGSIVQRGSHRDLINEPGLYQRLWTIQNEGPGSVVTTERDAGQAVQR